MPPIKVPKTDISSCFFYFNEKKIGCFLAEIETGEGGDVVRLNKKGDRIYEDILVSVRLYPDRGS